MEISAEIKKKINIKYPPFNDEQIGKQWAAEFGYQLSQQQLEEKDKEIERLKGLLLEYKDWEADIINENKLWWPYSTQDVLRGNIYDKMIELQSKRNALLNGK